MGSDDFNLGDYIDPSVLVDPDSVGVQGLPLEDQEAIRGAADPMYDDTVEQAYVNSMSELYGADMSPDPSEDDSEG